MGDQESKQELSVPGRPRSDVSHQAILQATMKILQQEGYRRWMRRLPEKLSN